MRIALFIFLTAIFGAALALPQAASAPKKTAPQAQKTAVKKKSSSSKKSGARTSARTSTKTSAKTAPAWHARQQTPTPERYREIQQALADKGYLKSEPNGVWDAQSMDALRQFQTDQKLSVTGRISSASLISLGNGPKPGGETTPAAALPPENTPLPENR